MLPTPTARFVSLRIVAVDSSSGESSSNNSSSSSSSSSSSNSNISKPECRYRSKRLAEVVAVNCSGPRRFRPLDRRARHLRRYITAGKVQL